jgi:uncharacterized protein YecE (DUF72 family)
MRFVACSGFPIPVSRYFREFSAVEISDSELGLPGDGTVRRWLRESPKGYGFSVLAPKRFAELGYSVKDPELKELATGLAALATTLKAKAVVFNGPEDLKPSKASKELVRAFVKSLPAKLGPIVLDLPAWRPDQVEGLDVGRKIYAAYDPLKDDTPAGAALAYVRLPGPAGHRSRYDEGSIEKIAEHIEAAKNDLVFCVFRNIDMHANAQQLVRRLAPKKP